MNDIMKKINIDEFKPMSTPMSTTTLLDSDKNGEVVNQREYQRIIGSLLYLMVIGSDIQFVVCLCTRFQTSSHSSHRTTVQ
jgi:hypothetical protein